MKEDAVRVKDGELFYRLVGRGEPLILLHSLGLSSESWQYVMEPLSKKFAVYAVDLMGFGDSDKPDRNYEIHHYANNIVEFMDLLDIGKARVMGNSIGAMIALEMSASFSNRVAKQVLVGCPAWRNAWDRLERLMLGALRYDVEGNIKPMTRDDLNLSYTHPTTELLEWVNNLRAKAGIWCKRAQIAVALWDIMPKLPMVSCPTLILFGDKDVLREQEQLLIQGIRGAKYALIEDAGHVPQIDAPKAFVDTVLEFL